MNNIKLTSFQRIITKNFATKAKIKFLGKRSLLTETNNLNNQSNKNFSSDIISNNVVEPTITSNSFTINRYRIDISEEESEIINNGGPTNIRDWTKITLKPKNKK
jgi:hypothetical protein